MAATVRYARFLFLTPLSKVLSNNKLNYQATRTLIAPRATGLTEFIDTRASIAESLGDRRDDFINIVKEKLLKPYSRLGFIDVINFVKLADSDSEIEAAVKLYKLFRYRFHIYDQNQFLKQLLLLMHLKQKPNLALDLYNDLNSPGVVSVNYCLLMDLLYENKLYDEALRASYEFINWRKSLKGWKYEKGCCIIAFACYCAKNTPESLEEARNYLEDMKIDGAYPHHRACMFYAQLAFDQNKPEYILEAMMDYRSPMIKNMKLAALIRMSNYEEAVKLLKNILLDMFQYEAKIVLDEYLQSLGKSLQELEDSNLFNEFGQIWDELKAKDKIEYRDLKSLIHDDVEFVSRQNYLSKTFQHPGYRDRRRDQTGYARRFP